MKSKFAAKPHGKTRGKPTGKPQGKLQPRPVLFREVFNDLWLKLFSTPIHLDSALSKAPQSQKEPLAEVTRLLLQRPQTLARFLRFEMGEREPWNLSQEELQTWPTIRAMGTRLFQTWRRDPDFYRENEAHREDYPPYLLEEWRKYFGDKTVRELVVVLAQKAPLSLRAAKKKGRNNVLSQINDSKLLPIRGRASEHAPFGFYFDDFVPILKHPLYKEGAYEIQDEGSQVMALFALWPEHLGALLRKVPGSARKWSTEKTLPTLSKSTVVIDACAGAGGKTLAMADAMDGKGQIFAYDISDKKLLALRQRARRMNLQNIKTLLLPRDNELEAIKKFQGSADIVLVDAPCSGLGVQRRSPDIKWRIDPESFNRLEKLQERLLDTYSSLVKPGGHLVYGVCTFRKPETEWQVENFLKHNPGFVSIAGGYYGPGPSDGFYFHALRREK